MVNKHMKKCSGSLAITETQIKTTIKYHYTLLIMTKIKKNAGEDVDHSYAVAGNIKQCSHTGK